MRFTFSAALVVAFLLGVTATMAVSQVGIKPPDPKGGKKPDPKDYKPHFEAPSQTSEIGGKTVAQWLHVLQTTPKSGIRDRSTDENAIRTILLFGPDLAYPMVATLIHDLGRYPDKYNVDVSIRVNGCIALGVILGGVKDPDPKDLSEAVSILGRYLRDDSQQIVRYRAAQALGRVGHAAKASVSHLIGACTNRVNSWETRQAATQALGIVAMEKEKAPDLKVFLALAGDRGAIFDPTHQVRLTAVQSLTWIGAPNDSVNKGHLEKVLENVALKDPEPTLQIWGHMALMSVRRKVAESHLSSIGNMLNPSQDLPARIQAAQALGTIGAEASSQIPRLMSGLKDRDNEVILGCMWALSRMGKASAVALPDLQKITADPKMPELMKRAAEAASDIIQGKTIKKK